MSDPEGDGPDVARWGGGGALPLRLTLPLAIAILVVWASVTLIGGLSLADGQADLVSLVSTSVAWNIVLAAGIAFVALGAFGLVRPAFSRPLAGTARSMWLPVLYLFVPASLAVASGLPTGWVMLVLLVNTLFVGLSEEIMFRGLLYRGLRQRFGIWASVAMSSIVFGAIHVLNVIFTADLVQALVQALAATSTGVVLAAMMLRTGSLVWPVLYHALWDFFAILVLVANPTGPGFADEMSLATQALPVLFVLPNGIFALWLIHRFPRHPEALARG